jgi:hypothetical protein
VVSDGSLAVPRGLFQSAERKLAVPDRDLLSVGFNKGRGLGLYLANASLLCKPMANSGLCLDCREKQAPSLRQLIVRSFRMNMESIVTRETTTANKNISGMIRRTIMWLTMGVTILLAILSIQGAFLGSTQAAEMFGSAPLIGYWILTTLLFVAGFVFFRRLIRKPGLLLTHLGCLLVLLGGIVGSRATHRLQTKFFDTKRIHEGKMRIYEGEQNGTVFDMDTGALLGELPFSIGLADFWMEYYWTPGILKIETENGKTESLPGEVGSFVELEDGKSTVRILRVFKNFKIYVEDGKHVVKDEPAMGINPAVQIEVVGEDGKAVRGNVYQGIPSMDLDYPGLRLAYAGVNVEGVKDYFSDLVVREDGAVKKHKVIEVNKPLYYDGYHFYQSSYDEHAGRFTILNVYSDSGLIMLFAGYAALCLGVIWQCWGQYILRYCRKRSGANGT